ncbi:nitrate ABC transporter, permease protein [Leptospira broomii serovar Hurstbridge str. 5399]|uniref:Nitrate ABC transporter, permease protein n=1 Tax=Leptospira broomii serovar Hurstbridge str. 5399 TaxID=1049789 RepID=T0GHL2_9LEPT|nr:nitrate ABC transporter permease [Leptospira broomii]EQA46339.1 nitrate ABC transporter, permease protein [Leptospira broomii serovar Hurstbridge str. 5399]
MNTIEMKSVPVASSVLETTVKINPNLEFGSAVDPERIASRKNAILSILLPGFALLIFGILWQFYSGMQGVTLPGPIQTIVESKDLILHPWFDNGANDKGIGWQLLSSLQRVGIGYSCASFVGVILGILIGKSNLAFKAVDPIFQVLRTIPPLGWLPISLAAFNKAGPSAIFVIFITSLWPIIINTSVGIMRIPKDYENISKVYQINGMRYFYKILLPAAAPYIFTGLRISIGMAWLAIVAAEMLTGGVGIGFFIWDSWNSSRLSDLLVALVFVGLVGLLLDRGMGFVGKFFGSKSEV